MENGACHEGVRARFVIDADFDEMAAQGIQAFKDLLLSSLALSVGIEESRVTVLDVTAGSILADFVVVDAPGTSSGLNAADVVSSLETQLSDPNSALRTGNFGSYAALATVVVLASSEPLVTGSTTEAPESEDSFPGWFFPVVGGGGLMVVCCVGVCVGVWCYIIRKQQTKPEKTKEKDGSSPSDVDVVHNLVGPDTDAAEEDTGKAANSLHNMLPSIHTHPPTQRRTDDATAIDQPPIPKQPMVSTQAEVLDTARSAALSDRSSGRPDDPRCDPRCRPKFFLFGACAQGCGTGGSICLPEPTPELDPPELSVLHEARQ